MLHFSFVILIIFMSDITLILPHQLFEQNPAIQKDRPIFLIEENLFFQQYNFHKQKLILHRASMKFYESYLTAAKHKVTYIETTDARNEILKCIDALAKQKVTTIHIADVVDFILEKRIKRACKKNKITLEIHSTPYFLNNTEDISEYFEKKKTYFQTDFYTYQRKKRNILLEADGKPIGGKWTFDAENRAKFPKDEIVPEIEFPKENKFVQEAKEYVQKNFPNNYGNANGPHLFVTTYAETKAWLKDFLKNRFEKFGVYEDSIVETEKVLNHSVLSPMINIGLISPQQIIDETLAYASENDIPLNSLEGFIRQVIGWREFIRIVYVREGVKQRTTNFWGFHKKIPGSFWTGTTGIVPIDSTIKKILETGYCHHIERLMVLGNFMLLCEFDPNEIHRWFMEMFIDAYDWVMVPNVYGMTQFADGGLMTTKPYISGSNYLMKMSDYKTLSKTNPENDWHPKWDGLFWRFMDKQRAFFLKNPRLGMLVHTFDKMSAEKKSTHLNNAEKYLASLN
jgi:deoxyribodipyrimidine photolyase-related protein